MRLLNGSDLAGFIKQRQAQQVRALRQAHHLVPTLAIVQTRIDPVIDKYIQLKKAYGADILVEVHVHTVEQSKALALIQNLNQDDSIHGIIVQLPLPDPTQTDTLVDAVTPAKDVDGLGQHAVLDPATPMAVNWLLAGYNVELRGKKIVIVGQGRLVGKPLARMFENSGYQVATAHKGTENLGELTRSADVLITAAGVPRLITSDMIKPQAVVVDAGVATDAGKLVGDLADDVRDRQDLTITPPKGGVGPLTVCALFENVIRSVDALAATPQV